MNQAAPILCATCQEPELQGASLNSIGICPTCVNMTMEFECRCFMENAKDGDLVKSWLSPARPGRNTPNGYVPSQPYIPCPDCGRTDRIRRISSRGSVMRIRAADVQRIGAQLGKTLEEPK